ncbi:MAG: hypothetical protein K2I58_00750 [Candidatus Amulumruptor sp.]|nr:hypothetical protein [Candidatus Amulumruptor sp.]
MMLRNSLIAAALGLGMAGASAAPGAEARLLRFPAVNGSTIVFSYGGDLYSVPAKGGQAPPQTSHEGNEIFHSFSPAGSTCL